MSNFLCSMIVGIILAAPTAAWAVVQGDVFPTEVAVSHHEAGKGQLNIAALKGKVTVVNFWATWCAACKIELVEMEDVFRGLAGEKDFNVAYVSLDKNPEEAVEWFRRNLKEPDAMLKSLYVDKTFAAADKLQVDAFPMTLVIDKAGKIVHIQRGFKDGDGTTDALAKMATDLLKK